MASSLTWGRRSRAPWRGLAALLLAACAALCLFVVAERASAQQDPLGAPTIGTVTITPVSLTVNWSAPSETGGSAITAYDVRYILTSATDKADEHWTLARVTGGSTLQHALTGLRDSTSYDIQVRAVNADGDGPWSTPARTVVTTDHGGTRASATPLALASPVEGRIEPATDVDRFRIRVTTQTDVWIYSTGALDTTATLYSASNARLASNDDAHAVHGTRNFGMAATLAANADYVLEVRAGGAEDVGLYTVHVIAPAVSTNQRTDATEITPGVPARGDTARHASAFRGNWFKFSLTERADVSVTAVPDRSGTHKGISVYLYKAVGTTTASVDISFPGMFEFVVGASAARNSTLLDPGTYYLRTERALRTGGSQSDGGPYTLYVQVAADPGASKAGATALVPYRLETGRLSSATDTDYFTFTLDREEMFRANIVTKGFTDIPGVSILDESDTKRPIFIEKRSDPVYSIFPMRARLPAGTYYLRITAPSGQSGTYFIESTLEEDYRTLLEACAGGSLSDSLSGCQWHLAAINVQSVWETGGPDGTGIDGKGITVVVVDEGVQIDHEDLAENVHETGHHDYVGTGIYHSGYNHGTAMAGVIAADDNSFGLRGVAPGVKLYSNNLVRDFDRGPGLRAYENAPDAMTRNMVDVAVSSNSYGHPGDGRAYRATEAWKTAVESGLKQGFSGKGISYVFSAGNDEHNNTNSNLDGWSNFYGVITVGAVNKGGAATTYSESGANVWVCGPSGVLQGATAENPDIITTTMGNRYGYTTGTSAATAVVSGVVALVRAANTDLTWRDVKLILAASAQPITRFTVSQGALQYGSDSERYTHTHRCGFGRVDAAAAVELADGWTPPPPFREAEAESGPLDLPIPDGGKLSLKLSLGRYVDFVEFIEVELHFDHTIRAMHLELVSPSSAVSRLAYQVPPDILRRSILLRQRPGSHQFGSGRHLGESAGGTWTLTISNLGGFAGGVLESWRIKAYGHGFTPGFPPIPTATSGMRTLTIGWDAPTDIGDSAVTSYDLRYIRSDASGKTDPANWAEVAGIGTDDTGTYEITGLRPGVQYDLKVRAANDTGPGPWSESLVVRSPLEQPFAPSLTGVTPRDQGLGATWDAPTEDGGSEITSYDLRSIRSNATDTEKLDPNNWTETLSAWTPLDGDLQGRVAGLTNGVAYDVQVRAENAIGEGDWSETLKGKPAIQNTDASFADDTADREVAENLPVGVDVGARVSATDPDGDRLTYSILGGHNLFEIDAMNGQLRTKAVLDFDTPPTSYTFTVDVSDMLNSSDDEDPAIDDSIEVTVTVTNVNEQPVVMGTRTIDHAENAGTALANASYSATDPEGANIIWSVGGIDKDFFAISSGGVLSFAAEPDFEARPRDNTYEVTVQATEEDDGDPQTGTHDVTVTVTDVDEPELLVLSDPSPLIGLDFTAAFKEGMGDAVQSPTWVWARSMSRSGSGTDITGATAATYRPVGADRDNYLRVTASYNDGHSAKTLQATSEFPTLPDSSTNRPPVFPSPLFTGGATGLSVDENATAGTVVGLAPQATDPELGTLSYSLAVAGFTIDPPFEINATSRQIQVAGGAVLDHEDQDSYSVTVTAEDEYNATKTATFDITVEDVNERPVIIGPARVADFPENSPTTKVVGSRYSATDPEGAGVTWSDLSGNDAGKFELDSDGDLTFKTSPNYEQKSEYEVTLNAYDGRFTGRLDVTVTIADENEQPMVTSSSGTGAFSIAENSGTTVGDFDATDPEGHAVTWSLASGGDSRFFEIDETNAALSFKESEFNENEIPDYESTGLGSDKAYNVTVRATEADDGDTQTREPRGSLAVTVAVTDVNEPPTITENAPPSVPENTTAVATYRATDPDERATITWSVEDPGASDFTITNAGALSFASAPNYEFKSSYTVTVRASDGPNNDDHVVTVTVTDVDEPEVLTLSDPSPLIGIPFTAAFKGTGDNVDNVQPPTWAWARSAMGSSSGWMPPITDATNATYEPTGDDRERYLRVTVSYNDGHGAKTLSKVSDFTTKPDSGTNKPPAFPSSLFTGSATGLSVDENATAGTVVGLAPQATDEERGTLSYSLAVTGFTTDAPFEINATSRQIRVVRAVLNHEGQDTYGVTVTVKDEYNATATATFDITIDDVNERPVAVDDPSVTTAEDTPVTFDVLGNDTDPDDGDSLTVRSTSQPRRGRVLVDSTRQMVTYTPVENDHGTYTFTYTAMDASLTSATSALVTVTVRSVNDAPEFATETTTRTVSESAQQGDEVGTKVEATDVDDITLTYSLSGASEFVIDDTGQISVAPRVTLDRELISSYEVTVTAIDRLNESDSITVTINVSNVNDPPVAANDTATTAEDKEVIIRVLDNDTDPDTEKANLRVSVLTQPLNGRARVESDRTITYTPKLNFAGRDPFTYRLSDGSLSDDGSVTVTVEAVNDAPEFATDMTTRTVSEGAQPGDKVGTKVEATDVDDITLTYSLAGASEFVIDDTGQISVAPGVTLDRERISSYEATVTATDRLNESDSITVTINVSDVPEPPTAVNDTATTAEDQSVKIDVLANDTDPDTERAALRVSVLARPLNGTARVESDRTITYTPNANFAGENSFTYRLSDGSLSDDGSVTVTVEAVNDAPVFPPSETGARSVPESAKAGDNAGAPVTATDVDNAMLTYRLSGADGPPSTSTVTARSRSAWESRSTPRRRTSTPSPSPPTTGSGEANATAMVEVTITVTAGPVLPPIIIITAAAAVVAVPAVPARARSTSSGP